MPQALRGGRLVATRREGSPTSIAGRLRLCLVLALLFCCGAMAMWRAASAPARVTTVVTNDEDDDVRGRGGP